MFLLFFSLFCDFTPTIKIIDALFIYCKSFLHQKAKLTPPNTYMPCTGQPTSVI